VTHNPTVRRRCDAPAGASRIGTSAATVVMALLHHFK
jgi:hypothetical protein